MAKTNRLKQSFSETIAIFALLRQRMNKFNIENRALYGCFKNRSDHFSLSKDTQKSHKVSLPLLKTKNSFRRWRPFFVHDDCKKKKYWHRVSFFNGNTQNNAYVDDLNDDKNETTENRRRKFEENYNWISKNHVRFFSCYSNNFWQLVRKRSWTPAFGSFNSRELKEPNVAPVRNHKLRPSRATSGVLHIATSGNPEQHVRHFDVGSHC